MLALQDVADGFMSSPPQCSGSWSSLLSAQGEGCESLLRIQARGKNMRDSEAEILRPALFTGAGQERRTGGDI